MFYIAKQIQKQNQDIVAEKCAKDDNKLAFSATTKKTTMPDQRRVAEKCVKDDNKLAFSVTTKKTACKQHQRPINKEFPWDEIQL